MEGKRILQLVIYKAKIKWGHIYLMIHFNKKKKIIKNKNKKIMIKLLDSLKKINYFKQVNLRNLKKLIKNKIIF